MRTIRDEEHIVSGVDSPFTPRGRKQDHHVVFRQFAYSRDFVRAGAQIGPIWRGAGRGSWRTSPAFLSRLHLLLHREWTARPATCQDCSSRR